MQPLRKPNSFLERSKTENKTLFHMAYQEGQFDVVELLKIQQGFLSINLNARQVNGMTLK